MTRYPVRSAPCSSPARFVLAAVLGLPLAATPAMAQEAKAGAPKPATPAAAGAPARADDKLILPFIGEGTFMVGRLDLDRVDAAAFEQYVNKTAVDMFKPMGLPPAEAKAMSDDVAQGMKEFREGLEAFRAAGGHHVYMLMDSEVLGGNDGPVLVVPLGKDADREKLTELFTRMGGDGSREIPGEVGDALVLATQSQIDGLRQRTEAYEAAGGKPAPEAERPDLASAVAAAGDVPFRMAFVPGEQARTMMQENLPSLPQELGGGDPQLITRGIRWATVAFAQKPAVGMTVTLRAADADSAKGLMDLMGKIMELAKAQPPPPTTDADTWAKQLASIVPKQKGETITITMEPSVLQSMIFGMRMQAVPGGAVPPQPAVPDDGGL